MHVFAIASNEPDHVVQSYVDKLGLTFPVLLDTDGSALESYAMKLAFESAAYPQDWVVGSDGTVIYSNNGFEPDEIRAAIDADLAP